MTKILSLINSNPAVLIWIAVAAFVSGKQVERVSL